MIQHHFIPGITGANQPTLLLLHGTGGDENSLLELGRDLLPGAALLSPRGQVLEHGMPRFFRRLALGLFDEADLIQRTHELADFVTNSAAQYGFNPQRVIAVGYSNGANIAAATLLLRPQILAGAVLLRAMVPLRLTTTPDLHASRVFLAAGQHDSMVPAANTEELATLLRTAGAEVTLRWSPGGHELSAPEVAAAKAWLSTHLHQP